MTDPAFTHLGKEILAHGVHYADAADITAARFITDALNAHVADVVTARFISRALNAEALSQSDANTVRAPSGGGHSTSPAPCGDVA